MEQLSLEKLIEKTGSIYKLCNLAVLRAVELNSGAKCLVDAAPSEKVTSLALREIAEDCVKIKA